MVTPTNSSYAAAAWASHNESTSETCHEQCLSKLDPLTLTLCPDSATTSRNVMEDPMLEEFATLVVIS